MHSDDRILELKVIDGTKPLNVIGMVDPRLFRSGGNRLHAMREPQTSLWRLVYEQGSLPPQLRQKFTSFNKLMAHVRHYYGKRNLEVYKVTD